MFLLSLTGFAVLIAQWLFARRNAQLWPVVLLPCLLVLAGDALRWGEMSDLRSVLGEVERDRMWWFLEGSGEVLNLPALAATLASVGFSHAVWLAASRIRRRCIPSRAAAGAVATFALGVMSALVMLGWRWQEGGLGYGALILAPIAALITGLGLLVAVSALRGGDSADDRVRQSTSDFVFAGLAAATSAAMMGVASHSRILADAFRDTGGESVDPSQKARLMAEGLEMSGLELGFGWTGACVVVLLTVLALASLRLIRSVQVTPAWWLTVAAIAIALPIPWMNTNALADEARDYREGAIGELVEDRSVPSGTLLVMLDGLTRGVDPVEPAEVRATGAAPAKWRYPTGATLSIPPGTPFQVSVGEPYIARVAGPFTMPAVRGARLRIGVLRSAPGPAWTNTQESFDDERLLQLDTTDPARFRLFWSQLQNVYSGKELPRSMDVLPGELRQAWNAVGYHRNDADRKFDTAVIRYLDPPNIDELVQLSNAIQKVERTCRGETVGAFKVFVLAVKQYAEGLEPGELERIAELEPQEAAEAIPGVIERCKVKCPRGEDVFGRLIGQSCGELRCSVSELAGLRMKLGVALALRGDRTGASQQFETALLMNPESRPDAQALPEAREAFAAVRAPDVRVRLGALTVNGRISSQQIASVVEGRMGLYRACGSKLEAPADCRIAVRFVIVPDGGITNLANGGSDCPSPAAVQCVITNTHGTVFPPPQGGIATVVVPFKFSRR